MTKKKSKYKKEIPIKLLTFFLAIALCLTIFVTVVEFSSEAKSSPETELQSNDDTYYVSPDGDDENSGETRDDPWQTLDKAGTEAEAGDTVILLEGEYPDKLQPQNSGEEGNPIIFKADERHKAVFTGDDAYYCDWAPVDIDNRSHIILENLNWTQSGSEEFLHITDSSYIEVIDCLIQGDPVKTTWSPVYVDQSEQISFIDNNIKRCTGDTIIFENSHNVLIEGNYMSKGGHACLVLRENCDHFVIRGNVLSGDWTRAFATSYNIDSILFEDNIITNSYNGGRCAGSPTQVDFENGVWRYNRFYRNWDRQLRMSSRSEDRSISNVRYYNNLFHDNFGDPIQINADNEYVDDVFWINNIFSKNNREADFRQIRSHGVGNTLYSHNVIVGDETDMETVIGIMPNYYSPTGTSYSIDAIESEYPDNFSDNIDVMPDFVDSENCNHALPQDSPLRDAGTHLTQADGSGSESDTLTVDDASYFYDGFDIDGEEGDVIAVGSSDNTARITDIDYENDVITLDENLSWSDGDPVSLEWEGEAPDVGAYENDGGRVNVQVKTNPFEVEPDEDVSLSYDIHGDVSVDSVTWYLGDGSISHDDNVTHSYSQEDSYGIRLRVTSTEGEEYVGVGTVEVWYPRKEDGELLHTHFDGEHDIYDGEWWWRWQCYRPGETSYERVYDEETEEGYLHIEAPEDETDMPAWIHPRAWNIDDFPKINITYRVGEGTPIAFVLRAWSTTDEGVRRVPIASTPSSSADSEHVLNDDGGWHDLKIDARSIREEYPDVDYLQGFRIRSWDDEDVEEGDWYDVGDFSIETIEHDLNLNSEGEGTTSPTEGTHTYEEGEHATIEAIPSDGWKFVEWTGDNETIDDPTANQTSIEMLDDYTITAEFKMNICNLEISSTTGGSVIEPGENTFEYDYGKTVDLEATANGGYQFVKWIGDNETIDDPTANHTSIEMLDNYVITAEFKEEDISLEKYILSINTNGEGSTNLTEGTHTYEEGEEVMITASPDEDWEFVEWTGDVNGTDSTISITMDANKSVTAVFQEEVIEYELTINSEGEGEVTTIPTEKTLTFEKKEIVTLKATPADGWKFVEWMGDVTGTDAMIDITVDSDKNITAHFKENIVEYDLTINIEGEGTIEPSNGTHTYKEAEVVTIKATLAESSEYIEWRGDVTRDQEEEIMITMDEDKEITVVFKEEKESEDEYFPGFTTMLLLLSIWIAMVIYNKKKS